MKAPKTASVAVERLADLAEQARARALALGRPFMDPLCEVTSMRLRRSELGDVEALGERAVAMGTIWRTPHGGSIRTFHGGQNHECGWWPSAKSRRNLHWEGVTQRSYIQRHECEHDVLRTLSEPCTITFPPIEGHESYTPDVEVAFTDGRRCLVELKRTAKDLSDPGYRLMLAMVSEILRRIDIDFRIVFADEVFHDRTHRLNVELFSSRRFASITRGDLITLERHGRETGQLTSYGALSRTLRPGFPPAGKAIIQALLVQRRVDVDLTQILHDNSPVVIA